MYSACERFGIKPPGVEDNFEDCDTDIQANLLAYDQIRKMEEQQKAPVCPWGMQ